LLGDLKKGLEMIKLKLAIVMFACLISVNVSSEDGKEVYNLYEST
jgi:hypothetical protein